MFYSTIVTSFFRLSLAQLLYKIKKTTDYTCKLYKLAMISAALVPAFIKMYQYQWMVPMNAATTADKTSMRWYILCM